MMDYSIEKDWEYKGLRCVVIASELGHRCGYVGVRKGHPFYKIAYDSTIPQKLRDKWKEMKEKPVGKRGVIDVLCHNPKEPKVGILFDVHGGITFSEGDGKFPVVGEGVWWFGFDCAHYGDAKDMSIMSEKYQKIELTYPSSFPGDIVRSLEYCINECESLAVQLQDLVVKEGGIR